MHELRLDPVKQKCLLGCFGTGAPDMLVGKPFFSWKLYGLTGAQSAFQLILSDKCEEIVMGKGSVWDSGWVMSSCSSRVVYTGKPLADNHDYYAAVRIKDGKDNISPYSDTIKFSTGFGENAEWQAPWLCGSTMFRKEFTLSKAVKRARLFICGLGYYEAYINGKKAGDRLLDPSWTDFSKRACYTAYTITDMLGMENAIGILLGNGWYTSDLGRPGPVFTAQIIIEYIDGDEERIRSEPKTGWFAHTDGPMRTCNIFLGEEYDAQKEKKGWDSPGFNTHAAENGFWIPALEAEPPTEKLTPMIEEPIRAIGELAPVSLKTLESGFNMVDFAQYTIGGRLSFSYKKSEREATIVDFGQNLAGCVKLRMNCPAGTRVMIRYAEILHPDGTLNTDNLRAAQQRDVYIARGGGEEYMARFTYHGFRYAEISGLSNLKADDVTAVVIRNDVMVQGSFKCANKTLNQIQHNCLWTESNNLHSVPTDCPQRDERQGWLNDLTVRAEEAVYNFDMSRFYRKFLMDISEAQGKKTGAIADTSPFKYNGAHPADPVCSSYLILPWLLYTHYGDKEVLERHYDGLAAWVAYLEKMRDGDGTVLYSYYGDWAAPVGGNISAGISAVSVITPGRLMSTGYLHLNARIMADIARVLGKDADIQYYESLSNNIKETLNRVYLNRERGCYATNSQAANTFMLYLEVVPEEYRAAVIDNLVKDIRAHDTHLTTGNLCSRYIFDVLAGNGHIDLAYELITQTSYPGWGYMLSKGATTTWERWEYVESGPLLGMASHNHPMYSSISGWFYKYLLGISPIEAGFKTFSFKPHIPSALSWVEGVIKSVKGDIKARWEQKDDGVYLNVTVPFNSCCRLILPRNKSAVVNQAETEILTLDGEAALVLEPGVYEIYNK